MVSDLSCLKCGTKVDNNLLCPPCLEKDVNLGKAIANVERICMAEGFYGTSEAMQIMRIKCGCDKCKAFDVIGPGTCTNVSPSKPLDFDIINCKKCGNDYGLFPMSAKICSSVDCPHCAENMPLTTTVNGFKLPKIEEVRMQSQEVIDHKYNKVCKECGEESITLIDGICNVCLSKKDDEDVIDYPKHYNAGKIQPIDAIEDWKLDFRLANAVKYIARHKHKGSAKKDLEKAIWYIQRYIDKELDKEVK